MAVYFVRKTNYLFVALFFLLLPLSPISAKEKKLKPGDTVDGIHRQQVIVLGDAESFVNPDMVVDSEQRVWVAMVNHDARDEWLEVLRLDRHGSPTSRSVVWKGARAWHPRLAADKNKGVWLTWCGRKVRPTPGDHNRNIFIARLGTEKPSGPMKISRGLGRFCDPDIAVDKSGSVHVVFESSDSKNPGEVRIAYSRLDSMGHVLQPKKIISDGPFDRRPALCVFSLHGAHAIAVAWDSLQDKKPTGEMDPDYDIYLRMSGPRGWTKAVLVDAGIGIQAAPYMIPAIGGGVLVAYHSSLPNGLVKHWTIRRVRGEDIDEPVFPNPDAETESATQQQGSEFPSIARLSDQRLAIISRPSQGNYLQIMSDKSTSGFFDLTRAGWGSRGIHAKALYMGSNRLWVVRRARKKVVLERFVFKAMDSLSKKHGPRFRPVPKSQLKKQKKGQGSFQVIVKPAELLTKPAGLKACVGDVHMHSAASDATGPPDEILARAWVRGLDYGVMTDHDNIVGHPQPVSEQDELAWLSDLFNEKKGFSTLQAYEWTTPPIPKGFGHRNVYFRDYPPDCWCKYKGRCHNSAALFHKLRHGKAIAIPHHTKWTGTDWDGVDEEIQRQFEMVSVHGANETTALQPIRSRGTMKGMAAQDGLAKGLHFGFVAGSDAHGLLWHHGIARKRNPWLSALTIAYATECSRHEIFDAIYDRRTTATSGVRILVESVVAKTPMGSSVSTTAPVLVQSAIRTTRSGFLVEVIRDATVVHSLKTSKKHMMLNWLDKDVAPGEHYYYIRVTSHSYSMVEMAWSSPVFVTVQPGSDNKGEIKNDK